MAIRLELPPPQPKQILFMTDKHKYVIFGGSRGGGKSFAIDEKAIFLCSKHPGIKCCIIRRTYPELRDNHIEPLKNMLKIGMDGSPARFNSSDKEIIFLNGSKIRFRYCDNENALRKIQGQEMDVMFVDEATHIPEEWLKKMYASVRGANNHPKRIYLTCNPGGVSHGYIYRLMQGKFVEGENADEYNFIQSTVFDNKALLSMNEDYVRQLEALPPKLKDAWLYGRWDVFEGAFFEEFRESPDIQMCHEAGISVEQAKIEGRYTHVIEPFDIPSSWNIWRSYDFGYGKPFSLAWWAISPDNILYRILELYGCTKTPNEGVRWTAKEQFDRAVEIEREHPWLKGKRIQGVADPSIWDGSKGISVAEEADKHGLWFSPGVNDRIPGWMQVRERMKFDKNGFPMIYFFKNCEAAIRTMPLMMYDEHKAEDLDTDLEDHAMDEIRYMCMARPIPARITQTEYVPISDPLNQWKKSGGRYQSIYELRG